MAYIFRPYNSGNSFAGQIGYGMQDMQISTELIKYIDSVHVSTFGHIGITDTGFRRRVTRIDTPENRLFEFQISGNCPKYLVQNLRSLANAVNGGCMPIRFYDNFFTGQSSAKTYLCSWVNAGDFIDNNVLMATAAMSLHSWEIL